LLDWARKKRQEEMELEVLAKEHPSIKDLVDQINLKKEQIKMVKTLIQSPGNDTIKPSMVP
jgi:myo-inositol catabolism protein IolC